MRKKWRPKNWDKLVKEEYMYYGGDRDIFEAGADAILEELRKMGTPVIPDSIFGFIYGGTGTILFIPDEEP